MRSSAFDCGRDNRIRAHAYYGARVCDDVGDAVERCSGWGKVRRYKEVDRGSEPDGL